MIDNVIRIAEGRVIYEGPRSGMEPFFAFNNNSPTPTYSSQVDEHYLSAVSRLGKKKKERSEEKCAADEGERDMLADAIETCFLTAVTTVVIRRSSFQKSKYLKKRCGS